MIYTRIYDPPAWNRREIMRYARIRGADDSFDDLIDTCIAEAEPVLSYRVCYTYLDVKDTDGLMLGNIPAESTTIRKAIRGADTVLLFATTVGAPFDRLIHRYSALEPSKALILQAIGAERVESLCGAFSKEINTELCKSGKQLTPRVSPGYGDIPLSMQRDIFAVLDCPRKIGLTLDESLLMSPSKSVTALCGVIDRTKMDRINKCSVCTKTDCAYRDEESI